MPTTLHSGLVTRLRQGLTGLLQRSGPPSLPTRWRKLLTSPTIDAWHALSAYDKRHLVAVARDLERMGCESNLVLAGLLHDIGKPTNTMLPVRAANVLLKATAPRIVEHIQRATSPPPGLKQLHLLLNHADRGADLLEQHGENPRIVWLVQHHEDSMITDPELATLQQVDDRH